MRRSAVPQSLPNELGTRPIPHSNSYDRKNLVRLFSSEIDEMDDLFDGKPPSMSRQVSSNSQFDELFDDENFDSFSMGLPLNEAPDGGGLSVETPTPTNGRDMLFKVIKESGFHQSGQQQQALEVGSLSSASVSSPTAAAIAPLTSPTTPSEEAFRPRNLSVGRLSSRCSTPRTMCAGGATTPCLGGEALLDKERVENVASPPVDPFYHLDELKMPRFVLYIHKQNIA